MVYTKKQRELLKIWQENKLKRITLLEGSVSSGKTWISLVLWAFYIATAPKNGKYLMAARSLTTLKRNCLAVAPFVISSVSIPSDSPISFSRNAK